MVFYSWTAAAWRWYEARLVLDSSEQFRILVWERDNPSAFAEAAETHSDWAGLSWKFYNQQYSYTQQFEFYEEAKLTATGLRTGMVDGSGSTAWQYDTRGRMTSESKAITGSGTFVTSYTYNSADLPASMTYPGNNTGSPGETVTFTYNSQMLLTHSQGSYTYVNDISYDEAGRIIQRRLGGGNQLTTAYTYLPWAPPVGTYGAGKLATITSGNASPFNALQSLSYSYSKEGNVLTITDARANGGTQTQTFTYDTLDRLSTARATGGSGGTYSVETYSYNADTGNVDNTTPLGNYTYLDSAHIHAVTHLGGVQKYWYDPNGNMTKRISGANTYEYTFDGENRLTDVSGPATANFVYDGNGVRVKGTVGSVSTAYIGNYFEWTGSTSTMKKYFYAGSTRVAVRTGTGYPSWLLGDHLGSQALTVDYAGTTETGEKRYDAWGEQRYNSGTTPTTFRYTGQRVEEGLGIYYYGARWMDPTLGRFLSADTAVPGAGNPQAWDRYAYTFNSPMNYTDPNGHQPCANGRTDCNNPHNYDKSTSPESQYSYSPMPNVYGNDSFQTSNSLLDGPGYGNYGTRAEEGYDSFYGSGASQTNAYAAGMGFELLNMAAEFVRDDTEFRRWKPFGWDIFGDQTVEGSIYYTMSADGITFTGASVTNNSGANVWIDSVYVNNSNPYQYNYVDLGGYATSGVTSYPVSLDDYRISWGQSANFTINVHADNGFWASVGVNIHLTE